MDSETEWAPSSKLETPFAEAPAPAWPMQQTGETPAWSEALSPFSDTEQDTEGEADGRLEEVLEELHDDEFHEAVALLAEDTEQAVAERFTGEASIYAPERARFAETYLSGVRYEADQYLASLAAGLAGQDLASLKPEQMDEVLDRFDPSPSDLSVAGEEFIGKIVSKAKKAAKVVAGAAKIAGKLAMPLLLPVLGKLRGLVAPLLKRVLSLAIGRLPAPLQPAARTLAAKLLPSLNETADEQGEMAAAMPVDSEGLADSFDLSLAEAIVYPEAVRAEGEMLETGADEAMDESRDLEALAEARGALIDRLGECEGRDLAPAIEQFVPAVLAVLRTGIKLAGRPKVVGLLAGYVGKLIGRYLKPEESGPLSRAIVDTGMRLASLEAEAEGMGEASEASSVALASVVEDTVRRFAENEGYVFEDRDLSEVAMAQAFGEAVATHFPQEHVRGELQLAPSLGGTFVTRAPRGLRSYAKFSRTPEVVLSARAADALPAFGGATVGATIRAAGGSFPHRARLHVFQARPGSTVAGALRHDRKGGAAVHPLTPQAAGLLLREPGLGARVPARFLRNQQRVAAGQRFYVLEPLGTAGAAQPGKRAVPGRVWLTINPPKARITLGFHLSEPEAQKIADAMRRGGSSTVLLNALVTSFRQSSAGGAGAQGEDGEALEEFTAGAGRNLPAGFAALLRKRIREWALPALAAWLRENSEAFLRATADPRPGVTLRVRMTGVPGLSPASSKLTPAALENALRGKPAISIFVGSGKRQ